MSGNRACCSGEFALLTFPSGFYFWLNDPLYYLYCSKWPFNFTKFTLVLYLI